MDPEQTAPDLGPHCLPWRLLKHFSRREKQTTFVAIGALRVKFVFYVSGGADLTKCTTAIIQDGSARWTSESGQIKNEMHSMNKFHFL